jgi:hypothetical protein
LWTMSRRDLRFFVENLRNKDDLPIIHSFILSNL